MARRRLSVEERVAELQRAERESVRRLRDHAEGLGGSVPRTLSRLGGEVESEGCGEVGCATASAKAQHMMIRLCLAFDLDLAKARCATEWVRLGLGGQVSDEELEAVVGTRFVARDGDVVLGSSDLCRQALRQHRIRTLVEEYGTRPLSFRRSFHIRSCEPEGRRVVLRSWDGTLAGFGALEIEFDGVLEVRLPSGFRGSELSVSEDPDGVDTRGRLFLLADGTAQRSFVRCASVRVYRSGPAGGSGTGTEPPDPWAP
ncbi:hypothetical protein ACXNSR_30225 [Streptomyces sp. NC-S4]